jgi:hypothetical protein
MPSLTSFNKSNKLFKFASGIAAVTAISLTLATSASAVQPTVNLGSTSVYAVLAGAGITNTGATTISGTAGGDLGSAPTAGITGDTLITTSGAKHPAADAQTLAAKDDLVTAYNDAAGRIPATTVAADLGGQTLTQGVYKSASSLGLTGTLTLDAEDDPNAVFIFQAGSTLTTASSSDIVMVRGAQACNVFWQVGSSATFGTDSNFIGHVFALESITANTRAVFEGQLLARNGAVTLDTNTITNNACASVVPPTDEGGELPNTDTVDWLIPVSVGAVLIAAGVVVYVIRKRRR